jgi:hypothetical protein
VTLDDDVASLVARLRKERDAGRKDLVNNVRRCGLNEMTAPAKPREPFRTESEDSTR